MDLGNFSVSLPVKELSVSQAFYTALGFETIGGDAGEGWVILRNGACTLGLFQGMFAKVMLTFNPGWDSEGTPTDRFTDVREIQRRLKAQGIVLASQADEGSTGPASCVVVDPDGNPILIDQHV